MSENKLRKDGKKSSLLGDMLYVIKRDKKWWLLPLLLIIFALVALLGLVSNAGPLAPFLYPLI